jgi:putative FmdB family regulatory protein
MFEARQRMSDDPLSDCPNCDEEALRRVINSVGIVFKGSGFYVTDNRNGKNGAVSSNGSGVTAKETDSTKEPEKSTDTSTTGSESAKDRAPSKAKES